MTDFSRRTGRLASALLFPALLAAVLLLTSCAPEEKNYTTDDIRALDQWLDAHRESPSVPILRALEERRSVLLVQDNSLRSDTVLLMTAILPSLYDSGIREIGVFFLIESAQDDIDLLLIEGEGDLGKSLTGIIDPRMAYIEYLRFLEYVRDFNAGIGNADERLRLTSLPEPVAGTEEDAWISAEGDDSAGETAGETAEESDTAEESARVNTTPLFLWLLPVDLEAYKTETSLITAHHGLPAGLIEETVSTRDIRDRSFAFPPEDPLFAGQEGLSPIPEAETVIVTPYPVAAVSPIDNFVAEENLDIVRGFFPDTGNENMPGAQANAINRAISAAARRYARELKKLN